MHSGILLLEYWQPTLFQKNIYLKKKKGGGGGGGGGGMGGVSNLVFGKERGVVRMFTQNSLVVTN